MPDNVTPAAKTERVNTFLGVDGLGECLPGPYRPFGLVRLGPDMYFPQPTSGYRTGKPILHFSHTHCSGTGGDSRYGNVGILPFTGEPRLGTSPPFIGSPVQDWTMMHPIDEEGSLGYYRARLPFFGITAELTTTDRVGLHRYTFPPDQNRWILIDAGAVIQTEGAPVGQARPITFWDYIASSIGGYIEQSTETTVYGRCDLRGGWGHNQPYSVYFWLEASAPATRSLMANDSGVVPAGPGRTVIGTNCRCVLGFGLEEQIELRVGISFSSVAQAADNVRQEVRGRSFDDIRSESYDVWTSLFDRYRIEGGETEHQTLFYSFLYRLYCMPTDLKIDQENPFWKSGQRAFTDYYCLWDSVRSADSFFHLFDQALSVDILNNLLDIADHTDWLPDAYIANHLAFNQSASAAEILFSEAALKNIKGIDYEKALRFMRKNAETPSPEPALKGRYVEEYLELHYLSTRVPRHSVSRHVEYTYHDWCIGQLAQQLGHHDIAEQYRQRSEWYWNLWRDDLCSVAPRSADGTWIEHADIFSAWGTPHAYEQGPALWTFNAYHVLHDMMDRLGGSEAFVSRLKKVIDRCWLHVKETRMHLPHLFTLAGRPDLAAEMVHRTLAEYRNARDGVPDNEDMGCQSAYFLWNSIGLFPVIGRDVYFISPPLFEFFSFRFSPSGPELVIRCDRTKGTKYIASANLNGVPLRRAWLTHDELTAGAILDYVLADVAGDWGREILLPPFAFGPTRTQAP